MRMGLRAAAVAFLDYGRSDVGHTPPAFVGFEEAKGEVDQRLDVLYRIEVGDSLTGSFPC
jgi:hypothetical protein